MNFNFNLSLVLAHSILYETKELYSPNGIVDDAIAGEDPKPESTNTSAGDIISSLAQWLPTLSKSVATSTPDLTGAEVGAAQQMSPAMAEINKMILQTYGPDLVKAQTGLNTQALLGAGEAQNQFLEQQGGRLAQNYTNFEKQVDPEYYNTRAAAGGALSNLLTSGLSGGEREEIQRSLNQQNAQKGVANAPTNLNTVENASTFGSALRDRLGQALQLTGQVLPTFRSGFTPESSATSNLTAANAAGTNFSGVTPGGGGAQNLATSFLGGLTNLKGNQMNIEANRRDSLDRTTQVISSLPSISL